MKRSHLKKMSEGIAHIIKCPSLRFSVLKTWLVQQLKWICINLYGVRWVVTVAIESTVHIWEKTFFQGIHAWSILFITLLSLVNLHMRWPQYQVCVGQHCYAIKIVVSIYDLSKRCTQMARQDFFGRYRTYILKVVIAPSRIFPKGHLIV